jgi:hypothetical protein
MASRCILLIATLPERAAYLREAIDSASRCAGLLDAVYQSVNGDSAAYAATICADYSAINQLPLHILWTSNPIRAVEHGLFILKQIFAIIAPTVTLLLLGDDDLRAPSERLAAYLDLPKEGGARMVSVGRFRTFTGDPQLANGECHSLEPGESASPPTCLARHNKKEQLLTSAALWCPSRPMAMRISSWHASVHRVAAPNTSSTATAALRLSTAQGRPPY